MSYSGTEITNIKRLVADADLKNLLLALEIVKGRGLVPELLTELYWIYNRLIWAGEKTTEALVYDLISNYLSKESISVIIPPDHQHALFFTHGGTSCVSPSISDTAGIRIMELEIRYWIPSTKDVSSIWSRHQNSAIFFTQSGINVTGESTITEKDIGIAKFPAESFAVHLTTV